MHCSQENCAVNSVKISICKILKEVEFQVGLDSRMTSIYVATSEVDQNLVVASVVVTLEDYQVI